MRTHNKCCTLGFAKYVKKQRLWRLLFDVVLESNRSLHVVLYEDVRENPINELRKIMQFIEKTNGYKPENLEERLHCLSENLRGGFKREHKEQTILYTEEIKQIINSQIDNAQERLIKHKAVVNITSYKKNIA